MRRTYILIVDPTPVGLPVSTSIYHEQKMAWDVFRESCVPAVHREGWLLQFSPETAYPTTLCHWTPSLGRLHPDHYGKR